MSKKFKKVFSKFFAKELKTALNANNNEQVQGVWMMSPWGVKYCMHPSVVDYYLAEGFTNTTPDENLAPGQNPLMVKDSSVVHLIEKWLAENGIESFELGVLGNLPLRTYHLPLAMILMVSALSKPEEDPFRLEERSKRAFEALAETMLASLPQAE